MTPDYKQSWHYNHISSGKEDTHYIGCFVLATSLQWGRLMKSPGEQGTLQFRILQSGGAITPYDIASIRSQSIEQTLTPASHLSPIEASLCGGARPGSQNGLG